MPRLDQICVAIFVLAACSTPQASAQLPPPKYEPKPIRSTEWGLSQLVSTAEEWTCPPSEGGARFRFSITTKRPPVARVFVNDRELDAKVVNDLLFSEVREGDLVRIDLTRCPVPSMNLNAIFALHYETFPAEPSYPLGYFSITPEGLIVLDKREPWPLFKR